ncbi:MAG: HEPN domain-containing protein [Candidatus Pacebacteria bacterium]|nr:HEPN domain-containing protein [Candidatus Paceibacterota bacterium]NCQ56120.1 HEPN domain-containing protein [Candidatus Parcubacteria bacterium]
MTQKAAVQFWTTSADHNLKVATSNFKAGHYDWALFFWHLVIEKSLKAAISRKGQTPIATHNLIKLSNQIKLPLTDKYEEYLKEITSFNLEARYDDYKFSFYKKATKEYTTNWVKICKEIYKWLQEI